MWSWHVLPLSCPCAGTLSSKQAACQSRGAPLQLSHHVLYCPARQLSCTLVCWHDRKHTIIGLQPKCCMLTLVTSLTLAAKQRCLICVCCFLLLLVLYRSWSARVCMTPAPTASCTAAQAVPGAAQQARPRLRLWVELQQPRKTCALICCDLAYLSYMALSQSMSCRGGCKEGCIFWHRQTYFAQEGLAKCTYRCRLQHPLSVIGPSQWYVACGGWHKPSLRQFVGAAFSRWCQALAWWLL